MLDHSQIRKEWPTKYAEWREAISFRRPTGIFQSSLTSLSSDGLRCQYGFAPHFINVLNSAGSSQSPTTFRPGSTLRDVDSFPSANSGHSFLMRRSVLSALVRWSNH